MSNRVQNPPPKPLLVWDGDCDFCKHWIERWRVITAGAVDYATYQDVADRFPEISREQFQNALVFIESNGNAFFAAEAVYRSLRCRSSRKWLAWSYDHVPSFAAVSEAAYKFIARHRRFASVITRLLWGNDVRPPSYFWARKWFLRLLGLVYLTAFVSLWVQVDGLIGANGIWPINQVLPAARDQLGSRAVWILPTLCWFNPSNAFLHFLCGGGVLFSLLLISGIAPALALAALGVSYLSLVIAGQPFLNFQWDILLIETGFISIFFAPWKFWSRPGAAKVNKPAFFLLKFLLFKLMLMSGVVKLTSGDNSWWNLTALDYHYWSQPLPTIFAWYADKTPEWFKQFSVAFCFVVEIIVPFFIWAPRRLRLTAAGLLIFLQIVIAITGNYCFFNLLTIALCLLLIDDAVAADLWAARRGYCMERQRRVSQSETTTADRLSIYAATIAIVITLPINGWLIFTAFKPEAEWPRPLMPVYSSLEPFLIANGYGLFRVMTKDRNEIVIEGSADGVVFEPYEFKWKPGEPMRAPGWCAPHQPRLDWQMWFAALGTPRQNPWFVRLAICLLEGKHDVEDLLERNPFPNAPPRYVRASFYRYRFTTSQERQQTGAWWKRQELREYFPAVSLEQLR